MAKQGRPKSPPKAKEMLKEVIPIDDIFDPEEKKIYESLVDIYLKDFESDDLTAGDMDDVMSLAMNRVLEIRLLKTSKGSTDAQLDIAGTIEKMRKQNEKLKESLSTRRKDRINPHEHKGFSIIDLAVAFEEDKKKKLKDKIKTHKLEENIIIKEYNKFEGNRYDLDVELEEGGDPS